MKADLQELSAHVADAENRVKWKSKTLMPVQEVSEASNKGCKQTLQ